MKHTAIAFILLVSAATTVLAAPAREIDVVVAAPGVSDSLLNDILAEARAIWAPADVTFQWHRLSEADATRHGYLLLTFDRPAAQTPGAEAPLGWITFEMGRPGHAIHLAAANAESLIRRTPSVHDTTMGEHQVLLGRALGRAFAHEAGHYLLNSKGHAGSGLMRAAWPAEQFLAEDRTRFGLAADQRSAVRVIPRASSSGAPRFRAVAFDYFVLFNPDSIVATAEALYPGRGRELTALWRTRQFEYSWLRSMTNRYTDFLSVTDDALVFACRALSLELGAGNKQRLMDAFLHLTPWPDTADGLRRLRESGVRVITIANFSPKMLQANADHAGLTGLFDRLVSTDANHTYKPDPRAYQLGLDALHLARNEIVFAAFGGWDAAGAKTFGYPTVWVNRFGQPMEELGVRPDVTAPDMNGLLQFVLGNPSTSDR